MQDRTQAALAHRIVERACVNIARQAKRLNWKPAGRPDHPEFAETLPQTANEPRQPRAQLVTAPPIDFKSPVCGGNGGRRRWAAVHSRRAMPLELLDNFRTPAEHSDGGAKSLGKRRNHYQPR